MTSRGAGRQKEGTEGRDGRDGLTTASHNRAETSTTYAWLSLPDKQMSGTKADKCMTCFTTLEWQVKPLQVPQTLGKHSWPRPPLPCCPLPYPTTDPTLRAIWRGAPCRRPHDLIKCNYHQPLVLKGEMGDECRGDKLLEGSKKIHFCSFFFNNF